MSRRPLPLLLVLALTGCAGAPSEPPKPTPTASSCLACGEIGRLGETAPPQSLYPDGHAHELGFNEPGCTDLGAVIVRLRREGGGDVLRMSDSPYNAPGELSRSHEAWERLRADLERFRGEEPLRAVLSCEAGSDPELVVCAFRLVSDVLGPSARAAWDVPPPEYLRRVEADRKRLREDDGTRPVIILEED